MRPFTYLRSLAKVLFRRKHFEANLADEVRLHLEDYVEDLVRAGIPRTEAERRARVEFGGIEGMKEECRQARGLRLFDEVRQDVRYGLRSLRRDPALTAMAVLSLALGIGANTTIFTLLDTIVIKMIPVEDPNKLVVFGNDLGRGINSSDPPEDRRPYCCWL